MRPSPHKDKVVDRLPQVLGDADLEVNHTHSLVHDEHVVVLDLLVQGGHGRVVLDGESVLLQLELGFPFGYILVLLEVVVLERVGMWDSVVLDEEVNPVIDLADGQLFVKMLCV